METFPVKVLIKTLSENNNIKHVWLQGDVEQTVGTDILIVSDSSGKAKITKCDAANGTTNRKWVCKGAYCCIIGEVMKNKGIPEIQANKVINLTNKNEMKESWINEVEEINLFLDGKLLPNTSL